MAMAVLERTQVRLALALTLTLTRASQPPPSPRASPLAPSLPSPLAPSPPLPSRTLTCPLASSLQTEKARDDSPLAHCPSLS